MVFGPLCSKNGYRFYFYFGLKEGIVLPDFKLSMFLGTYRFENGSGLKTGIGKKRTLYFGLLAHPGGGLLCQILSNSH